MIEWERTFAGGRVRRPQPRDRRPGTAPAGGPAAPRPL